MRRRCGVAEVTEREPNGQPLDGVVHAAKVAAVSAAVGAAAAAARAFASRHEHDDGEPEPEVEHDEEPEDSVEEPVQEEGEEPQQEEKEEEPVDGAPPGDARGVVRRAREQLEELLGKPVESVSSLERTHDGWVAALEVVELARVPESTDVLASYELELDDDLNFRRYQQARRYNRSQADRGDE
jgi:hypothetical protein